MLEFLQSHTSVVYQPSFESQWYSGINPYALGFAMFQDIKRICQSPTDEDKRWFPDIAGSDWLQTLDFAMRNFKDESFILQFLSPKVIRDFKFFNILDDDRDNEYIVTAIHDDHGYRQVRELLARQYNLSFKDPNIQVYNVDLRGDRSLTLRHFPIDRIPLQEKEGNEVLKHLHRLWGFDVVLESVEGDKVISTLRCPPQNPRKVSTKRHVCWSVSSQLASIGGRFSVGRSAVRKDAQRRI